MYQFVVNPSVRLISHRQVDPCLFVYNALVMGKGFEAFLTVIASHTAFPETAEWHFAGGEVGKRFPQIDLAIMENGQYNEDWRYIHLMPDDLPLAIKDLHPKQVLTVHHSKYALSKHPWYEPLENIHKASKPQSYKLLTPMIGEKILDKVP